ncbi:MAG: cytidine/deoxycytidylate deaminase family protein [Endomicrobium sp.]|jgi:dCMP deaminase|nr:cytidine/deoxycytidylate deaminase family protein [Endomicrobium sp.]
MEQRISWNNYFMKLAWLIAERSTCLRHHVGAVIVKNKRVLTTGYNGAAIKMIDCISLGCLRDKFNIESGKNQEICRAIHAEQNAIIQCGYNGINIKNSDIYITHSPCVLCTKLIINSGIKKVFIETQYADTNFKKLFKQSNIKFYYLKTCSLLITQLL